MNRLTLLLPLALSALACKPPPPAPEGLDESARYMVREFFSDDPTFQAGIQGFMAWYEAEGKDLTGIAVDVENSGAFTVGDLVADDVADLPLDTEIAVQMDGDTPVMGTRDVATAAGTVSIAEMECSVKEAEALLARADQDNVFPLDWEGYTRTFNNDPDTYTAGWDAGFEKINEVITPYDGAFSFDTFPNTLLFTDNIIDPTAVLTANIEAYPMDLVFRHGVFDVDGREAEAVMVLTFTRAAAWGSSGANGLIQSFSSEINIATEDGRTIRMLTVWAEPRGIDPDSPIATSFAVNKARDSSDCMSKLCSGEITDAHDCN